MDRLPLNEPPKGAPVRAEDLLLHHGTKAFDLPPPAVLGAAEADIRLRDRKRDEADFGDEQLRCRQYFLCVEARSQGEGRKGASVPCYKRRPTKERQAKHNYSLRRQGPAHTCAGPSP